MLLYIFHGVVIVLFIILGIAFLCGKGAFLIAGYNTRSKTEKEHFDERQLCRFMGKLMFILAACWFIFVLGSVLDLAVLLVLGVVLFIAVIIGAAVYANTGNRFRK